MSRLLYRLGRLAARRPWRTIGVWLIADAGSDSAGLTAQLVVTPDASGSTLFDDPGNAGALVDVQAAAADLPNVVALTDTAGALAAGSVAATESGLVSPDGRVAIVQLQYPVADELDYEVFLLSRVREDYLATRDNDHSIVTGIASTARVITSGALIMISVFLGFVLGDDPIIKMLGLGLATAIFVDATIVRMVLVPATMKLMGDANWWMPAWLDRLLPTIDIEGDSGLPEPDYEPRSASTTDEPTRHRVGVR